MSLDMAFPTSSRESTHRDPDSTEVPLRASRVLRASKVVQAPFELLSSAISRISGRHEDAKVAPAGVASSGKKSKPKAKPRYMMWQSNPRFNARAVLDQPTRNTATTDDPKSSMAMTAASLPPAAKASPPSNAKAVPPSTAKSAPPLKPSSEGAGTAVQQKPAPLVDALGAAIDHTTPQTPLVEAPATAATMAAAASSSSFSKRDTAALTDRLKQRFGERIVVPFRRPSMDARGVTLYS